METRDVNPLLGPDQAGSGGGADPKPTVAQQPVCLTHFWSRSGSVHVGVFFPGGLAVEIVFRSFEKEWMVFKNNSSISDVDVIFL